MKTMEVLVRKHVSHWQDEIAQANALGASPGALQKMEAALRSAIEVVSAMAADYGLDVVEKKPSAPSSPVSPTRKKSSSK